MILTLAVSGYRSLRDIVLPLGPLNVVTGANGTGKSSIYRALRLIADVAEGRVVRRLAGEGGIGSALWAGPEVISRSMKRGVQPVQGTVRKGPVALRLGVAGDDCGYAIDLGLPVPSTSVFSRDPMIKAEALWTGETLGRSNTLALRQGPSVRFREGRNAWRQAYDNLASYDSMVTHCANLRDGLALLQLRERLRDWRFYDHLRTDVDAPARKPQVGTYTPVLAGDGADLAAAIETIREIGDADAFDEAVADAFDRAHIDISANRGYLELEMRQHGLLRPLTASELSDGTLRYLLLAAALLSPRPPGLMILNEPETSLHPDLLPPLARLIAGAASRSQVFVVTHARPLAEALLAESGCTLFVLEKELGETVIKGPERPDWTWPSR